jgi:hypothetical protein
LICNLCTSANTDFNASTAASISGAPDVVVSWTGTILPFKNGSSCQKQKEEILDINNSNI